MIGLHANSTIRPPDLRDRQEISYHEAGNSAATDSRHAAGSLLTEELYQRGVVHDVPKRNVLLEVVGKSTKPQLSQPSSATMMLSPDGVASLTFTRTGRYGNERPRVPLGIILNSPILDVNHNVELQGLVLTQATANVHTFTHPAPSFFLLHPSPRAGLMDETTPVLTIVANAGNPLVRAGVMDEAIPVLAIVANAGTPPGLPTHLAPSSPPVHAARASTINYSTFSSRDPNPPSFSTYKYHPAHPLSSDPRPPNPLSRQLSHIQSGDDHRPAGVAQFRAFDGGFMSQTIVPPVSSVVRRINHGTASLEPLTLPVSLFRAQKSGSERKMEMGLRFVLRRFDPPDTERSSPSMSDASTSVDYAPSRSRRKPANAPQSPPHRLSRPSSVVSSIDGDVDEGSDIKSGDGLRSARTQSQVVKMLRRTRSPQPRRNLWEGDHLEEDH